MGILILSQVQILRATLLSLTLVSHILSITSLMSSFLLHGTASWNNHGGALLWVPLWVPYSLCFQLPLGPLLYYWSNMISVTSLLKNLYLYSVKFTFLAQHLLISILAPASPAALSPHPSPGLQTKWPGVVLPPSLCSLTQLHTHHRKGCSVFFSTPYPSDPSQGSLFLWKILWLIWSL